MKVNTGNRTSFQMDPTTSGSLRLGVMCHDVWFTRGDKVAKEMLFVLSRVASFHISIRYLYFRVRENRKK